MERCGVRIRQPPVFPRRTAGATAGGGRKSASGDPPRKSLEAFDALRESQRNKKRRGAGKKQDDYRGEPQLAAEGAESFADVRERNGKAEDNRRAGRQVVFDSVGN